MKIYLASPFFTPEQIAVCQKIEELVSTFPSLDLYSPRQDGVLRDMAPAERKASTKKIFSLNVRHMDQALVMIAVVDGRDTGTTWEQGYFYRLKRTERLRFLVTYTDADYGLNVMIQESVDAHCRGLADLGFVLRALASDEFHLLGNFRDFDPRVT